MEELGLWQALYANATPLLSGIGAVVIAALIVVKVFGIKLTNLRRRTKILAEEEGEEESGTAFIAGITNERRRQTDVIFEKFIQHTENDSEFQIRQTLILEKLLEVQNDFVRFLEKHDERTGDQMDRIERLLEKRQIR